MKNIVAMAADQRRPDHIALLFSAYTPPCGFHAQGITLTSTDGGSTWERTDDACGGGYANLAIAPDGALLRWSLGDSHLPLQVLDGWS